MKKITNTTMLATVVALVCLGSIRDSQAAKMQSWRHDRPADYDRAMRSGIVLSDSGTLRLSRRLHSLAKIEATHVWGVVEDGAGHLYAATGEEGKVFRITAGKVQEVYASGESQILSLCLDAKGDAVLAGTGPGAQVVRIDGKGGKIVCKLPESYVWALAVEGQSGTIYAATGPNGRIYKITLEGKATVFYETKQDHVLCLAVGPDGAVYAGTDKTGRVYRIDAKGKGFVLHQTPQSEVRALALTADALFVGTCSGKKRSAEVPSGGDSTSTASADDEEKKSPRVRAVTASEKRTRLATEDKAPAKTKESSKATPASAPSEPASGENSVYRIALGESADVRELFRAKSLVLSLFVQGNRLLVGTGMKGQLFDVDLAGREKSELARLDHGQILGLCRRKDGSIVVATGDPGELYTLEERYLTHGTLTSAVLDARLVSRWGAVRWRATTPAKGSVSVQFRSGNVAEVDETWSDWGEEQFDSAAARVDVPSARYLQYRLKLTSPGDSTPSVTSLIVRYATTNQAPVVTKIEVPNLAAKARKSSKKMEFTWKASDANEDELRYRLLVKKDGWEDWVQLEDDVEKTEYEWDTTTTPEGVYRLKVVASDHVDNDEKEARSAERISESFVVCHTPPAVKVATTALTNGRMSVEVSASSPLARLTAASFSLNGKKWVNLFPTDGLFDSKKEAFRFRTGVLPAGAYTIVVRVQDAAGNTGSGDVVFRVGK